MTRVLLDTFLNRQVGVEKALLTMFEPLAARVGGMDYAAMVSDPALWAANLAKTGRLLDMNGLVLGFEAAVSLEAEKKSVAMDAFHRLTQTERNYFGCIASMPGPVAMAEKLLGDGGRVAEVKAQTVETAEAFCKSRPDILMLREGGSLGKGPIGMGHRKAYNTLKNMAAYYSVPLGLYLEDYDPAVIADLAKLKAPFIFFGADQEGKGPSGDAVKELAGGVDGIAVPLDFRDAHKARTQAATYREELQGVNFLFTNLKELDGGIDLEETLALIRELRNTGSE